MGQSQDPESDYAAANTARQVRDLIRRGVVSAVQMSPPRCRISFGGEHQSGWLQWFTLATSERVDWSAPKIGDPVTVISEGGNLQNGVVLPGLLVDNRGAPSIKPNEHVTAYCDGATQTYDTESHTLTWQGVEGGTVRILAESKVEILGRDEITVTSENVVNIHGGKLINADAEVINVTATDTINAHADLVNVVALSSVTVTAAESISLTAETIRAYAPGGITLAGPTHITSTLVVDGLGTFRTDLSVEGDKGGSGNIRTAGSVVAGGEVQDRQGSMSEIRITYNGHKHDCPDGGTDIPSILMV
ncbi:phage baseplate assembly protein V [Salmonella enterica subsp. enterica serovar Agbeni]|nr:phage baseplate assembly protein V [Salmonella enterica subsp. enterica serovar Agbeni]